MYVQRDLKALLARYFPAPLTPPAELHCSYLRSGKREYAHLPAADRPKLLQDACGIVTGMLDKELRLFTVIVDKAWWYANNPGKSGIDLYNEAFEQVVNRFDLFLRRRHADGQSSKGIMIVDPCATDLCKALKVSLSNFQSSGTRWSNLYNVIESVFFTGSHESPGLQLADLCSYSVWRLVESGDTTLSQLVATAFDREPLSSAVNPGKWHGIKYLGNDLVTRQALQKMWI